MDDRNVPRTHTIFYCTLTRNSDVEDKTRKEQLQEQGECQRRMAESKITRTSLISYAAHASIESLPEPSEFVHAVETTRDCVRCTAGHSHSSCKMDLGEGVSCLINLIVTLQPLGEILYD